tara:strand:- start:2962 stop:3201 length:240 start_codon:yes stop_codon:yes gene_type:complete
MKSGDYLTRACSNCDFFKGIESSDRSAYQRGECRYEPPGEYGFPEIYSDWWCGKFEPNRAENILNKTVVDKIEELNDLL